MTVSILLFDEDCEELESLTEALRSELYEVVPVTDSTEASRKLYDRKFAAVVCNNRILRASGAAVLQRAALVQPDAGRIMLLAREEFALMEGSFSTGQASHLVLKPWKVEHLRLVVQRAVARHQLKMAPECLDAPASHRSNRVQRWSGSLESKAPERADDSEAACEQALVDLASVLDCREYQETGHSHRVAVHALYMGSMMGLDAENLRAMYRGGLLHDVGKIGVPERILMKEGALTASESDVIRQHVAVGMRILRHLSFLGQALTIPQSHHEWYDGSGYPEGLAGDQIPLEARIFAVVDVYDVLRTCRPYREALSEETARSVIRDLGGTQLDPAIVEVFNGVDQAIWDRLADLIEPTTPYDDYAQCCRQLVEQTQPLQSGGVADGGGDA